MFVNNRHLNLCTFILIITFLSSTALFCSNLVSNSDKDTPCFLESPTDDLVVLRSSGSSLVLPCHVAHSKYSSVEWWYTDTLKSVSFKIYPVFPQVRPTVLRFITSLIPNSKHSNETDILDATILLRHVNVDDSGIYRCVIRSGTTDPLEQEENIFFNPDANIQSLDYKVELTGPRLCQSSTGTLPCFSLMRTTSPTVLDAYQSAFLQCVVKPYNRPINVFWVVGDLSTNSVLITNHLTTNQYHGDYLRRVFPLSPNDHSIELSINRTIPERTYSCVIEGATDIETTIFTYIVRNLETIQNKDLSKTHREESLLVDEEDKDNDKTEKLNEEQVSGTEIKEEKPTES